MIAFALLLAAADPSSASALTKAEVRAVVEPTEAAVKECANAAGVHGTLRVTFHVNADGSVSRFHTRAPHAGDASAKCAQDAIMALKFRASSNGRQSKYRFQLGGSSSTKVSGLGSSALPGVDDALRGADFSACKKADKQSVRLKLTIGVDGTPGGVITRGKHANDDVGKCVAGVVSKVKFPVQTKPVTLEKTVQL